MNSCLGEPIREWLNYPYYRAPVNYILPLDLQSYLVDEVFKRLEYIGNKIIKQKTQQYICNIIQISINKSIWSGLCIRILRQLEGEAK